MIIFRLPEALYQSWKNEQQEQLLQHQQQLQQLQQQLQQQQQQQQQQSLKSQQHYPSQQPQLPQELKSPNTQPIPKPPWVDVSYENTLDVKAESTEKGTFVVFWHPFVS